MTDRQRIERLIDEYGVACYAYSGEELESTRYAALMAAIDSLIAEKDSAEVAWKTLEGDVRNLTTKVIPNIRAEHDSLIGDAARDGCPCVNGKPCNDRCTCVNPFSSVGCRYCAKYGSAEQRNLAASHIASRIDAAIAASGAK